MPVAPTYPGVYIEEVPSGVRTITGVATSITAFVGRASRGPVNVALTINSYADFERIYGGLWVGSTLGFSVRDFYLNGGGQAIVVRLYHPYYASETDRTTAIATATSATGTVVAAATAAMTATPATPADVGTAARTAADAITTEPGATTADLVASAAEAAVTGTGATATSVEQATTTARNAIATAIAQVTSAATTAAGLPGASATSVATAARTTADAVTAEPGHTAADLVAAAAETEEANPAATSTTVSDAADTAATAVTGAIGTVATAATTAAATTHPATAAAVATAARTAATAITAEPGKSAAAFVADATEAEAARTGATAASTSAAATNSTSAAVAAAVPLTRARIDANTLNLEAATEGSWGNALRARIDTDVIGAGAANLFNLTVRDDATGVIEVFRNVSVVSTHPRRVDKVLQAESTLVRARGALPASRPTAHGAPPPGQDLWGDYATQTNDKVSEPASDGGALSATDFTGTGMEGNKQGLFALEQADLFNLLCIPPYTAAGDVDATLVTAAAQYCERRRAMLIVDPPSGWTSKEAVKSTSTGLSTVGTSSKNAALFFPRLRQPNPLRDNQVEDFAPSGAVAGVMARTDATRGVWKAPAGLDATLVGAPALSVNLTDGENGELNPLGVNCLRALPAAGRVVWGARTLQGDDRLASEWKYVPIRRLALFLEESLYRGTQWVVFEPNDAPLWAQIRLNLGAFMQNLFRQGAFQGKTPAEAYFVKCDGETTTQTDRNLGIVNIVVGFAPLKPAEFVIIKIQQIAGQIPT